MKSLPYILGFYIFIFVFQEISSAETLSRVRVVKVRKSKIDKRQTQSLSGSRSYTDSPYDEGAYGSSQIQRPQDNPYNAGNRQVDYPLRDSQLNRRQTGSGASRTSSTSNRDRFQDDDGSGNSDGDDGIPGEAGVDYPIHATLPKTNFDCKQQQWPGYYADVDSRCQVFWICQKNRADAFLCPNGTLFNQQVFVCDWWFNVDCNAATEFYSRNQYIYGGPGIDLFGNPVEQSPNRGNSDSSRVSTGSPRRPNTNLQHAQTTIIPLTNDFNSEGSRNNYNRRAIDSDTGAKNKETQRNSKVFDDDFGYSNNRRGTTATTRKYDDIFATSTPILNSARFTADTTTIIPPTTFSRYERIQQESTTRKYESTNTSPYPRASGSYSPAESRNPTRNNYAAAASSGTPGPPAQTTYSRYSTKDARDNDNDAISHKEALRILSEIIASGGGGGGGTTPRQGYRNERKVSDSSYVKTTSKPFVVSEDEPKGYLPKSATKTVGGYSFNRNYAISLPPENFTIPTPDRFTVSASGNNFYSPATSTPNLFDDDEPITSTTTERTRNFNDFHYETNNYDTYKPTAKSQSSRTTLSANNQFLDEFESTGGRELFDGENDYDDDLLEFKFGKATTTTTTTTRAPPTTTTTTTARPRVQFRFSDEPVGEETIGTHKFSTYIAPTTFRPNFSDVIKRIRIDSSSMIGTPSPTTITTTTTPPPVSQFLESPTFDNYPATTLSPNFGRKVRSGRKRSASNWNSYFNINN